MLCSMDFRYYTRLMRKAAEKHCQGRLLLCHEGGYSEEQVPFCGLAVVEELSGEDTGVVDPFVAVRLLPCPTQPLGTHAGVRRRFGRWGSRSSSLTKTPA